MKAKTNNELKDLDTLYELHKFSSSILVQIQSYDKKGNWSRVKTLVCILYKNQIAIFSELRSRRCKLRYFFTIIENTVLMAVLFLILFLKQLSRKK